ncbi:MAG: hypothetical protein ACTSQA_07055 [Candidatus Heimdallarchaeaceae archaeon]
MKYIKIALVIVIILALAYCGYYGYNYFKRWEANRFSEMNMLKTNQDLTLKKVTTLSESITRIVNDTKKTTVEVKPDHTYESLKEQVIELNKDKDTNKEEIEALREELSEQRKAFLKSENTMLIKTADGEKILLYRDEDDNWQPASEGIDKIIEHKELSEDVAILSKKEIDDEVTTYNLKAGGYYDTTEKEYGLILSKGIFSWEPYSINASLLVSDFEDVKFAIGGDIGYEINDNLEIGVGYNTDKSYYIKLQYQF